MTNFVAQPHLRTLIDSLRVAADDAGIHAYIVGGTIRDVVLGRRARDLDLAVDGDGIVWTRTIADRLGGHFVVLGDARASARVVLDGGEVRQIDLTELHGNVEEDLRRRDFTINAVGVLLGGTVIVDPSGGIADLGLRLVRMTGPQVFDDDPLRLLRAARIASELGFEIEADTAVEVRRSAARVNEAAAERRRERVGPDLRS